jgi:uncharacterized protein YdaU (DUF1376 family)
MGAVITINRTVPDFVSKTRHLSVEDRGAYQEILDQIVLLGQDYDPPSLPDDDRLIANILGWSTKKWRTTKQRLCEGNEAVIVAVGGRLSQTRIVEEIEAARVRIAASAKAGVASGEARRKLSERMLNGRSTGVERMLNGRGNAEATPDERRGNADPNGSRTSHESRVTSNEESKPERALAGAREAEQPATSNQQPATPPPDFGAVKRVDDKLAASALKLAPPLQTTTAWVQEYGEDLIVETLADCEVEYAGKHFKYLESILTNRRDNPSQRPGQRRARRTDGNGNGSGRRDDSGGAGSPDATARKPFVPAYGQLTAEQWLAEHHPERKVSEVPERTTE